MANVDGEEKQAKKAKKDMKTASETSSISQTFNINNNKPQKPSFRPAIDDSKPSLQDPILRSDPMETEEAVLRLPPFPAIRLNQQSQ